MDAITYFLFNSGLLMLLLGLITFILGWLFGSKLGGGANYKNQFDELKKDYDVLSKDNDKLAIELKNCKEKGNSLEAKLNDVKGVVGSEDTELKTQLHDYQEEIKKQKSQKESIATSIGLALAQSKNNDQDNDKNVQVMIADAEASAIQRVSYEKNEIITKLKKEKHELQEEVNKLREDKENIASSIGVALASNVTQEKNNNQENTNEPKKRPQRDANLINQRFERSKQYYANDIESGKLRHDKDLGYLYTSKPDSVDDLTDINGVGEVLSKKMNDFGVYTFKQVALWNDHTADIFSDKLAAFKDRMHWDDWMGQAEKLHKEKYGEDI